MSLSCIRVLAGVAGLAGMVAFGHVAMAAQITSDDECEQAIDETNAAYEEFQGLGEDEKLTFEELVAQAETSCTDHDFMKAEELLETARAMVATD